MTSQVLKLLDTPKTQKCIHFENKDMVKTSFLAEVIFKGTTDQKLP